MESIKNWERNAELPLIRYLPKIIQFLGYDPEPEPESFPKRIAYVRRRLGFTQHDLARALSVDTVSIWRWEMDRVEPPAFRLQQVNKLLSARQIPIRL